MRRPRLTGVLTGGLIIFGVALALYLAFVRPWQLRWGATDIEVKRSMLGDGLVANPSFNATRAVTVDARPEDIWPWIIQIGYGRAGWYSYDWIDNLGRPSAERIIPELQHMEPGDRVPMGPGEMGMTVAAVEPGEWMVWGDESASWVWGLYPVDENQTRLITRVRIHYDWAHPTIVFNLLIDVGDIVMMPKCMLGIKWRAEALSRSREG
ncbi:MAG: hypothetical protein JSW58_16185 [Candidatus Latescibacterota bacterium]|nr:MAG: hypothetical protein JSW58_16185 [Candidatus Latescibacterota bacterium]